LIKRERERERGERENYLRIEMSIHEYHLIKALEVETYITNWKRSQ
jgi:hypothetical protein